MSEEELKKELEKLKDFKLYVFEWDVYVKAEDYKKIAIENKKLKEGNEIQKKLNLWERTEYLKCIKELKAENEELQNDLEHRDSFFSIMRDVLANETITNEELASILYCVIHFECWDTDMSKKEVEIAEKFWFRDYV